MNAVELLRQREFRGIRWALIARLIVLLVALPIDQSITVASRAGQINSLIGLAGGFVGVAVLLWLLHRTRQCVLIGIAAVVVDVALMAGFLVGWWDAIGGAASPTGLLLKTAPVELMTVFIVLNALTVRPLYPLLATFGMTALYIALAALAVVDPQSQWTNDFYTAFVTPAVSLPLIASDFALLLFTGALIVVTTFVSRRLTLAGIRLERINGHFARYFSPAVRDEISAAGDEFLRPGGRLQDVAVLFSDIRGFTALAQSQRPEALTALVSDYQSRMVAAVFANGGTLDKFIGDAVMATFGTPTPHPQSARHAVEAAIAMRAALAAMNQERAAGGLPEIRHGIGIHCGPAIVGNVGTVDRLEYTVMGDTVNVAALVTDHCKTANEDLLITGAVRAQLTGDIAMRELPALQVKGRREAIPVFAIDAGAGDVRAGNQVPDFGREA